ncbi:MFS transporter [Nocardia elegans]|uniref:MFS transporter n=1 Tax=Nocardia elegans TaxID=300029 RepID=UPI001895B1A3|nr:MFS transporter [Nocardia elegans]MBF6451181.1 MFS transporter [Nocardia elegans]
MTAGQALVRQPHATVYRDVTLALFAAGMATFMSLYYVQGLLPAFSAEFAVTPTISAMAVSLTTGLLALTIVPVSMLSERFGRVPVMVVSALASTSIGLLLPWSPNFEILLAGRAVQGLLCAGVPAVAMAYLVEEVDRRRVGAAMGIYVAGTSFGGLVGRLIPTIGLDIMTWNWAFQSAAVVALVFAVVFAWRVPSSASFIPRRVSMRHMVSGLAEHLRNHSLLCLFGLGFLLLGAFMTVYNYLAYRLLEPPFSLSPSIVGSVFLLYLAGTAASALAGRFSDRVGRGYVLVGALVVMAIGLVTSLSEVLSVTLVGVALTTAGFFAAHSIASGWVPIRAARNRSGASSLYLLSYYLGGSVVSVLGGPIFAAHGWAGLVVYLAAVLCVGGVIALLLFRISASEVVAEPVR